MIAVPFIQDVNVQDINSIENAFLKVQEYKVACCDWPDQFPYAPEVELRIFHTGEYMVIKYNVTEDVVAARVTEDMGEVWTDSCAEFFIQPYGTGKYYNLEATCIGKILLAHRSGRNDPARASDAVLKSILRYPSLGTESFEEKQGPVSWSLVLVVPASAFFEDSIGSFSGFKARCNVYKCGDKLSKPHFISFAPIGTAKPDFHRPEFFTEIEFE